MEQAMTAKPASAPPAADTLLAIVAEMRAQAICDDSLNHIAPVLAWATRIEALAASAQVREVERRCPYCAGRIYTDAGCQNCKVGTTYPKPAPEPVPVAQGIERFDEMTDCGIQPNTNGRFVRHADHARIVAELQYRLDTANAFGEQCMTDIDRLLKEAEATEASLAACRAELVAIRDSTFRNALQLRNMADRALSRAITKDPTP
jgi:hypothetical protein